MTLDKADHLLTKDGTAQRAARIIANWVEPYLVPENVCEDLPEFVAEASTIKASKYGAAIRTGGHNFITDRDKSQGGKTSASPLLPCWFPRLLLQTLKRSNKQPSTTASKALTMSK